jgi:hypothetical protein
MKQSGGPAVSKGECGFALGFERGNVQLMNCQVLAPGRAAQAGFEKRFGKSVGLMEE